MRGIERPSLPKTKTLATYNNTKDRETILIALEKNTRRISKGAGETVVDVT
jgi:hypothetical protein